MLKTVLAHNLAITLLLALTAYSPAGALVFIVDTTATDLGDLIPGDGKCEWATFVPLGQRCSLRAAVHEANAWPGEDVIWIPAGMRYEMMIADDLDITEDVIIGSFLATPDDRPTLDANGLDRMFEAHPPAKLTLEKIIVTGGRAPDSAGGAIRVEGDGATLSGVTLVGNSAAQGGALMASYPFPCATSTIPIEILDTDIERNSSTGVDSSVVYISCYPATITGSTIANNSGSALSFHSASLSMSNSTIAFNAGSGVDVASGILLAALTLDNVTTYGNSGTGLQVEGQVTARNSILANNGLDCDLVDFLADMSFNRNLDSDGSCLLDSATGADLPFTDPQLGSLLDNGGWTPTMVPQANSPVIDFGDQASCLSEDQRGAPRTPGAACELGAVELLPCIGVPAFVLSNTSYAFGATFEACYTIAVGPAVEVLTGGVLTLSARDLISFGNGFSVYTGGKVTATNDPTAGSGVSLP